MDVSKSNEAYWRLLADLWAAGEDFLVIEHDIEVTAEALAEAEGCECEWGVSPYVGPGQSHETASVLRGSLGFTRFRASILASVPDAIERVGGIDDAGPAIPLRDWRRIDARLLGVLRDNGHTPHLHAEVVHHHDYPYGCACGTEHG